MIETSIKAKSGKGRLILPRTCRGRGAGREMYCSEKRGGRSRIYLATVYWWEAKRREKGSDKVYVKGETVIGTTSRRKKKRRKCWGDSPVRVKEVHKPRSKEKKRR